VTLLGDHTAALKDTTPYFSAYRFQSFFRILVVTLLLELAFAAFYFLIRFHGRRDPTNRWMRFLASVCVANLVSLPVNHFVVFAMIQSYSTALLAAESIAIVSESIVIKKINQNALPWSSAVTLSFSMNIISVVPDIFLMPSWSVYL
jgi:hypothetical protein